MVTRRKNTSAKSDVAEKAENEQQQQQPIQQQEEAEIVLENGVAPNTVSTAGVQEDEAEENMMQVAENKNEDDKQAEQSQVLANDETAEDATLELNGTAVNDSQVSATPAEADRPLDKNFDNDSAAVVQHLSQLRLSVGPLALAEIHDKSLLPIMEACSGYQIHTPRVLNMEEDKTKYAMLDIEFLDVESAQKNKEALVAHFATNDKVKVENWPENKIYYNDYSYLQMGSDITTRMKDGVLIAGYSKLRDRWLVALGVEPEVSLDKVKELVGAEVVDIFGKPSKRKAYIRFDTKEAAKAAINKSVTVTGKNIKLKELAPHPSEKKGFVRNSFPGNMNNNPGNQRNNFQNQRQQQFPPYYQQMGGPIPPYNQMYAPQPYPQQAPMGGYWGGPGGQKRSDLGYYSNGYYGNPGSSPQFQQKRARY